MRIRKGSTERRRGTTSWTVSNRRGAKKNTKHYIRTSHSSLTHIGSLYRSIYLLLISLSRNTFISYPLYTRISLFKTDSNCAVARDVSTFASSYRLEAPPKNICYCAPVCVRSSNWFFTCCCDPNYIHYNTIYYVREVRGGALVLFARSGLVHHHLCNYILYEEAITRRPLRHALRDRFTRGAANRTARARYIVITRSETAKIHCTCVYTHSHTLTHVQVLAARMRSQK